MTVRIASRKLYVGPVEEAELRLGGGRLCARDCPRCNGQCSMQMIPKQRDSGLMLLCKHHGFLHWNETRPL